MATFAFLFPSSKAKLRIPTTVNYASIRYRLSEAPDGHTILLTSKDQTGRLEALLSDAELSFFRQMQEKDLRQVCFPRSEGMVWVRILQGVEEPALSLEDARLAGAELLPQLNTYKIDEVSIHNAGLSAEQLLAFTEGLALSSYQFIRHFSEPDKKAGSLHTIYLSGPEIQPEAVAELDNLVDAVCTARDLVNEPHGFLNAVQLADAVKTIGQASGFSVEILGKEKIETLKMGGLLAVNKASTVPPRFCVLEWQPASAKNAKPIVLIGKGVVYDTGGLSLKTPEGMEYMKCDMAGAASVIGALSAAARNQLPIHVVGLIPATDNAVNDHALSPGDVIRMYSGTTVEVVNTDAEGRLILADALHYAKKYEPELAIDLATLTGAAIRALGTQAICYMGTAPATTKKALEESGRCTYERLVELPLWREYGEELKSNIADLKNLGTGNAGMITAGKFLEHFTNYPWLHLDIAGPAYLRSANGYRTREGTGVGVRLLYHFLKNYASPEN